MSAPTLAGFLTRIGTDARPDGELVREYAVTGSEAAFAQLSPDGKRVGFVKNSEPVNKPRPGEVPEVADFGRATVHVLELGGKQELTPISGVDGSRFFWLGDGAKLAVSGREIGEDDKPSDKYETWVWDVITGKRTPLVLSEHHYLTAVAPDGKTALLDEVRTDEKTWHRQIHLWAIEKDDKPTPLMDVNDSIGSAEFSPDGSRLLCTTSHTMVIPQGDGTVVAGETKFARLVVIDLATKKQTEIRDLMKKTEWSLVDLAWSPDGKKFASLEVQRRNDSLPRSPDAKNVYRVMLADADGTNAKELYRTEGKWLMGFDWR